MITNKFIKSYAVIKSSWISNNVLDEYLPFIATIIKEEAMEEIDENRICQKLLEKYAVTFQPTLIRQVLSHAMSKNIVTKVREVYKVNNKSLEQYIIPEENFNIVWNNIIDDFLIYAKKRGCEFEKAEVEQNIVEFVDCYDDHIIYNNIGDIDINDSKFLYNWCNYILKVKECDTSKYDFILALCSASLLKNTLFYTTETQNKKSDLKVYLDTPMIFALLGMDTIERQNSYKYVLQKAKDTGMSLYVFDHNYEEAVGIMERASRWALSAQFEREKASKVAEFFHDSEMNEQEIVEFISDVETVLNSYGIIQDHSAYLAEENNFQADEMILQDAIKTEYGKRALKYSSEEIYDNSIQVDVRSLVMIQRKRSGGYSTDLKNSRYIFITTNSAVAKVSKDYAATEELTKDKIPSCITADIFGTLIWMDFPEDKDNYLSLKMLADCKALLRPTAQMIAQFNLRLDEALKKGEITEEKFLFLRSHPIVRDKLLDVTSGDYAQFTNNTWRDVYNSIESHAKYEGEKKYEIEKEEHIKTREDLGKAMKEIVDKNNEIEHLDLEVKNQREKFSAIIAHIISIPIFGVPYVLISVVIALIQNSYLRWSIKGIAIGAVTIIVGIIASCLYKRCQKTIKKKLEKIF